MLLKGIECEVLEANRASFSRAQQGWSRIGEIRGFLGQTGGWEMHRPNQTRIVSFWQDEHAYRIFMEEHHDDILADSGQRDTYQRIKVGLADRVMSIPGRCQDPASALSASRLLRWTECRVREERILHFREMQSAVWNPAMSSRAGMMWGAMFQHREDANVFWVVSLWKDPADHDAYAREAGPLLREQADLTQDAVCVEGVRVMLEPQWTAVPESK